MARLKSDSSSKGRVQQKLKRRIAKEAARTVRVIRRAKRNDAARHQWLVRHFERQHGRCAYCRIPIWMSPQRGKADRRATLDHVVPLSRMGPDSEVNTVAACEACNTAKRAKSASLYRFDPFCVARRKFAETLPDRREVKLQVVRKRPRRRAPPPHS